nr:MAG TPA_asm: hypothetical protein [Caudoviricetes sp.]
MSEFQLFDCKEIFVMEIKAVQKWSDETEGEDR